MLDVLRWNLSKNVGWAPRQAMMAAEWCVTFQLPPNRCYVTPRLQILLTLPNNNQCIARHEFKTWMKNSGLVAHYIPHGEPAIFQKSKQIFWVSFLRNWQNSNLFNSCGGSQGMVCALCIKHFQVKKGLVLAHELGGYILLLECQLWRE